MRAWPVGSWALLWLQAAGGPQAFFVQKAVVCWELFRGVVSLFQGKDTFPWRLRSQCFLASALGLSWKPHRPPLTTLACQAAYLAADRSTAQTPLAIEM